MASKGFSPLLAILAALALVAISGPAWAHRHEHGNEAAEAEAAPGTIGAATASTSGTAAGTPGAGMASEHREADEAKPTSFGGRLLAWAGHMHPVAVHFPVALFPISLIALLAARRRHYGSEIVRVLIILTGAAALLAGLLGWLDAGFRLGDTEPVLTAHRWLGTVTALIGVTLALWAWRRREAAGGRAMAWALAGATLVVFVQGGLGAVLTHGVEHLAF